MISSRLSHDLYGQETAATNYVANAHSQIRVQ